MGSFLWCKLKLQELFMIKVCVRILQLQCVQCCLMPVADFDSNVLFNVAVSVFTGNVATLI